ncbi:WhiB family transcriptional regulator [Arthrobacter woluwensis]|jgi:WhiB family transcriptional regulator, redox-sensing transcriptional regulator|uniref:WhiB family transcriptional regulator n=1 Tax=Arthrobacter woluwensis TaxID=156980 RepID=UPI001AAE8114|nr:WhiB family transcriptional regulator [Arthrobacter woluwensis]QTF70812.1 WhiB family transcriptional regulator [Arthrobacter woluwensis]
MGQTERIQDENFTPGQAAYQATRTVPEDWFLDPADPERAQRFRQDAARSLEDQATAFLTAHEPAEAEPASPEDELDPPLELFARPEPSGLATAFTILPGREVGDESELSWQAESLCAQTDPEAFFPEKGGSTRDAKKVCAACTVRQQCLEYALANDERFGIWGGLSERERRRLRKRAV